MGRVQRTFIRKFKNSELIQSTVLMNLCVKQQSVPGTKVYAVKCFRHNSWSVRTGANP